MIEVVSAWCDCLVIRRGLPLAWISFLWLGSLGVSSPLPSVPAEFDRRLEDRAKAAAPAPEQTAAVRAMQRRLPEVRVEFDQSAAAHPTNTSMASGNPLTAPVDYLGAVNQGRKSSAKTLDIVSIKQAIEQFQAAEERLIGSKAKCAPRPRRGWMWPLCVEAVGRKTNIVNCKRP